LLREAALKAVTLAMKLARAEDEAVRASYASRIAAGEAMVKAIQSMVNDNPQAAGEAMVKAYEVEDPWPEEEAEDKAEDEDAEAYEDEAPEPEEAEGKEEDEDAKVYEVEEPEPEEAEDKEEDEDDEEVLWPKRQRYGH
jgi:hypothetical protein